MLFSLLPSPSPSPLFISSPFLSSLLPSPVSPTVSQRYTPDVDLRVVAAVNGVVNVNATNKEQQTPLHLAARAGSTLAGIGEKGRKQREERERGVWRSRVVNSVYQNRKEHQTPFFAFGCEGRNHEQL